MPLIRAINTLKDGAEIVTTALGKITISSADLSAADKLLPVKQAEAKAASAISAKLSSALGAHVDVLLIKADPMQCVVMVSDLPIDPAWKTSDLVNNGAKIVP